MVAIVGKTDGSRVVYVNIDWILSNVIGTFPASRLK